MFKFLAQGAAAADAAARITLGASGVRGATGLSRGALIRMVLRDGLFGRDSAFGAAEQQAILDQLGAVALPLRQRVRAPAARRVVSAQQLAALRALVACAVGGAGTVSRGEWRDAARAGLDASQRCEVLAIVGLLRDSLGLPGADERAEPCRAETPETTLPHAA